MDKNSVDIAGWLEGSGIREGQYPSGWIRVRVEPVRVGNIEIPAHPIFLNCNITDKNRQKFNAIGTEGWITVVDCTLDSYVPKNQTTERRKLKFNVGNVHTTNTPQNPVNVATLYGRCMDVRDGHWLRLAMSYRNIKTNDWKQRMAVVYSPNPIDMTPGSNCYVEGMLSGRTLDNSGEDFIVVAKNISG